MCTKKAIVNMFTLKAGPNGLSLSLFHLRNILGSPLGFVHEVKYVVKTKITSKAAILKHPSNVFNRIFLLHSLRFKPRISNHRLKNDNKRNFEKRNIHIIYVTIKKNYRLKHMS